MSLTSRIQALTAYANEVTGESDTTLADAVATLASGYGGGGTGITDGIVVKGISSNGRMTSADFYGSVIWANAFVNQNELVSLDIKTNPTAVRSQAFRNCRLAQIVLPVSVSELLDGDIFRDNPSLTTVHAPGVARVVGGYHFSGSTHITDITIGSVGHSLTSLATSNNFISSASLVVTIYTVGDYVDTLLSKIRASATNGTIVIKASENTTYNGTSYSAGDTILTSTPS